MIVLKSSSKLLVWFKKIQAVLIPLDLEPTTVTSFYKFLRKHLSQKKTLEKNRRNNMTLMSGDLIPPSSRCYLNVRWFQSLVTFIAQAGEEQRLTAITRLIVVLARHFFFLRVQECSIYIPVSVGAFQYMTWMGPYAK